MQLQKLKIANRQFCTLNTKLRDVFGNFTNIGYTDMKQESPFQQHTCQSQNKTVQSSKLSNGVTVVTENTEIPSTVHMGILLNVGTRDENSRTSGALHSIYTTYYKSFANTNETINYGMVQMSGGTFKMGFDRERSWFKASCLSHDVVDLFYMMSDCALEPRNFNTMGVAQVKLPLSHSLQQHANGWSPFSDTVFQAMYGKSGLGNLIWGDKNNYKNLDSYTVQQFQLEHVSPEKMVVCGIGVQNHGEFKELVENRMSDLYYNNNTIERDPSQFNENDVKIPTSKGMTNVAVCFEDSNLNDSNILYSYLLSEILGSVEVNQFDPQNLQTGQLNELMYKKLNYIKAVEAQNFHFSDSGAFVLRGTVMGDNTNAFLQNLSDTVKKMNQLDKQILEGAKKRLKLKLIQNLDLLDQRVEEYMKQQSEWSEVKGNNILNDVDKLDQKGLQNYLKKLLNGKCTLVVEGPDVQNVQTLEKVKALFKQ